MTAIWVFRYGDEIKVVPDPAGGWYYEIRWADGYTDWGFRLTRWGASRAANRLLKERTK